MNTFRDRVTVPVADSCRTAAELNRHSGPTMNKTHIDRDVPRSNEPPDFSLVLGGPLFQLLVRSRLATPALELIQRRIIFISLFAWLPLLLLSLVAGKAWGGGRLPFLYDLEMHARFLIALPLLIGAELLVHRRLRLVVAEFIERDIIIDAVLPRFKAVIASAMKLRNSATFELFLLILIFVGGHFLWSATSGVARIATHSGTWYATATDGGGAQISPAGYWYIFVSRPLFQFILVRWYFRLFVWARFLWKCSRLQLNLVPTHPDRAAGLGFLGVSSAAFAPLLLAHGALLAGLMANPIFFAGAKLTDFRMEILGAVVFLLLIVLGPMLAFWSPLMRAKRTGLREYGRLASRYVREFDLKWVRGGATDEQALLGSGDIQSLADLGNSFQVIRDLRPFPFGRDMFIQVIIFPLIPVAPLVLTMIPLDELIKKLVGAVF
jgi:hypothetical protein